MAWLWGRHTEAGTLLLLLLVVFLAAQQTNGDDAMLKSPQTSALASAFLGDASATLDLVANSTASATAVGDPDATTVGSEPRDLAVGVASAPNEASRENQPLVAIQATAVLFGGAATVVLLLAAVSRAAKVERQATGNGDAQMLQPLLGNDADSAAI